MTFRKPPEIERNRRVTDDAVVRYLDIRQSPCLRGETGIKHPLGQRVEPACKI
jgi:hypothetical protein